MTEQTLDHSITGLILPANAAAPLGGIQPENVPLMCWIDNEDGSCPVSHFSMASACIHPVTRSPFPGVAAIDCLGRVMADYRRALEFLQNRVQFVAQKC